MTLQEQITTHALSDTPKECCGLVVENSGGELEALPVPNSAKTPEKFFRIDPLEYLKAKRAGNLRGYYHSHPDSTEEFSPADIAISEATLLPLYLYVVGTQKFLCYTPTGYVAPLEGRTFVPFVHDCWALVHDYFREELDIQLPLLFREEDESAGYANVTDYIRDEGMKIVQNVQKGDIILMAINSSKPNHAAVYLGDGVMLHQRANDVSRRDVYGGYWEKVTVLILRHPRLV